jgi:outer membrane protein
MKFFVGFSLLISVMGTLRAQELSLSAYLDQALTQSEDIRAIEMEVQSLRAEIDARDLELSPTLELELNRFWDRRPSFGSNTQISGEGADLTLSKPFATGTEISLLSGLEASRYQSAALGDQNLFNWEVGVSQSLWQNSFGRQTRLRRKRDQSELRTRFLSLMTERQRLLIEYEWLYWDLAYAQEEVRIREENLGRSRRILTWIQNRLRRAAAERIDSLQAEALVTSRDLQLQVARDNLKRIEASLAERFSGISELKPQQTDFHQERALSSLLIPLEFSPSTPILLDALRARAETDYSRYLSQWEKDRLKPVLEVGYAYGQLGLDASRSQARREAFNNSNRYQEVGVVLATPLNFPLISQSRRAFEIRAEAQGLRAERLTRGSEIQWTDLERNVREQKVRVDTALKLSKLQRDKSNEERTRYERGRTTAFQAITFEQEAAESELLVLQLLAQLRRTEAQARAYTQSQGAAQ